MVGPASLDVEHGDVSVHQIAGLSLTHRYGEVTAPPHLFSHEFFPELAELQHGARPVLARHRDRTIVLSFPRELLLDIDTPEDYERAKSRVPAGR